MQAASPALWICSQDSLTSVSFFFFFFKEQAKFQPCQLCSFSFSVTTYVCSLVSHKAWYKRSFSSVIRAGPYQCHGQTGSLTHTVPMQGHRDGLKVNNACARAAVAGRPCGSCTVWREEQCRPCSLTHNPQLKTRSPSVVLLLFFLMKATVPCLVSSEPSTELLLIALSSSFFPVTSTAAAATAAAASSSSSSSWSEYWLKASTSSLKISSLMNPPSGTQSTCQKLTSANLF